MRPSLWIIERIWRSGEYGSSGGRGGGWYCGECWIGEMKGGELLGRRSGVFGIFGLAVCVMHTFSYFSYSLSLSLYLSPPSTRIGSLYSGRGNRDSDSAADRGTG